MTGSPPEDPSQFRGKTLTPVSPKPVHYPSPSNIPILEAQMEPNFNESPAVMAYSTSSSIHPPDSNPNRDTVEAQHQHQSQQAQQHQQFSQAYSAHTGANNDGQSLAADAAGRESSASSSMQYNLGNNGARTMQDILYGLQGISSSDTATGSNPNGSSGELFQSLLDTLSPPAGATTANAHSRAALNQPPSAQSNYVPQRVSAEPSAPDGANGNPNSFTEGHNLPPRPPPQEKPATHPNYAPGDDIRSYHPHSQKNPSASYRAQAGGQPAASSGQAGLPALLTQAAGSGMPLPPGSSFSQPHSATGTVSPSPATPASAYRQRDSVYERNFNAAMEPMRELKKSNDPDDAPWGPEVQKLYDQFLSDERSYVTEGQWDKFPANSRLFVGNLPSEKVTKRDLFHIFFRHGRLAQISIKQAYGFIQYLDAESCLKALRAEEGRTVRGRRMRKVPHSL
ncbi:hypothetical protein BDY21DRAFT_192118 [Lineolata rhizophorae]|uniref:RRM domain-containing protein n=1 Tax=Lineolata rhizophorae TaxID=578093 RepID=A0A6A6P705_9PEZI|nr:hypothetical protein BDY21DRAFT_192118 [Lineolata rhizophorae]